MISSEPGKAAPTQPAPRSALRTLAWCLALGLIWTAGLLGAFSSAAASGLGPTGAPGASGALSTLLGALVMVATTLIAGSFGAAAGVGPARTKLGRLRAEVAGPLAAGLGLAAGTFPGWCAVHWFMVEVTLPGMIGLQVYLAIWQGLAALIWALLLRRSPRWPVAIAAPVLIVGLEHLRTEVVLGGYPWYTIGQSSIDLPWARVASIAGVTGVSLVTCCVCVTFLGVVTRQLRWRAIGATAALVLVASLAPALVRPATPGPGGPASGTLRVGVVQTNLPQSNKISWPMTQRAEAMARWLALSQRSASGLRAGRPDLIVWPETMFPGPALNPSATAAMEKAGLTYGVKSPDGREIPIAAASFAQALAQLQATTGVPMLIGAIAMDGLTIKQAADRVELQSTAKFNSAVLVEGGAVSERRYDKIELTPFGEYMPFVWRFPAVQQALVNFAAPGMGFDLTRGTNPAPLELAIMGPPPSPRQPQGRVRLAVPICYEISFPAASRRLVYQGSARTADVMVNISNDGWFGDSDFSRGIHTLMGRWRCIELGVAMVRAVNTGQSCAIDALGNVNSGQVAAHWADASSAQAPAPGPAPGPVTATATLRREGLLETELPIPVAAGTLFGKIGDWLGPLCGIVTTGSLVWGLFGAGRGRPAQSA